MKYLPTLLIMTVAMGCDQAHKRPTATANTADTVLFQDIIRPVTDSIQHFPDNHALYYRRALLLIHTNPALAQADFAKAAKLMPSNTDYWAGAGTSALMANDYPHAVAFFSKALATAPNAHYLKYQLATAMIESQAYSQADSIANVLAQTPDVRDKAYYLKARIAEDQQDTATAIKQLLIGVRAAGATPELDALMELGDLLRTQKKAAAVNYYLQAWKLDTTYVVPLYEAAQCHEELGQQSAAIAAYRQCILTDPGFEPAYLAIGKIFFAKQQWKEAYGYFNLATKSAPTDAWAYYYRGKSQERRGNEEEAILDYRKAASFKKNFSEANEALKRLYR